MNRYVAVIFVTGGKFVLQNRDDKPSIANPGMVGVFAGKVEDYDTTNLSAIVREANEETSLHLSEEDFTFFKRYKNLPDSTSKVDEVSVYICHVQTTRFKVYEGRGSVVIPIQDIENTKYPITLATKRILKDYVNEEG